MKSKQALLWMLLGFGALVAAFLYSTSRSLEVMSSFVGSPLSLKGDLNEDDDYTIDEADVAVLNLEGEIMNGDDWIKRLKNLEKRNNIRGIVIRIDSPGGAVAPSQEMYTAVMKIREKMPVYCSMGDLAASGGYYVASACTKIYANPGTLTGSIGVIMSFMNFKGLYAWAKVEPTTLKAGKFKDIGSDSRAMTPEERDLMEHMLASVHAQFKAAVLKGRPSLSKETIETYADGRVFSGEEAKTLGFVDELGGLQETLDALQTTLGIKGELKVASAEAKRSRLAEWLQQSTALRGAGADSAILQKISSMVPQMNAQIRPGQPYLLPYHWFQSTPNGTLGTR
ncbi:MAG: signal peptide peptidase SppA [Bdellovibrionota bacterium]